MLERMRRLVCAFYDGLNFGKLVRRNPDKKGLITDVLIGNLFHDAVDELWREGSGDILVFLPVTVLVFLALRSDDDDSSPTTTTVPAATTSSSSSSLPMMNCLAICSMPKRATAAFRSDWCRFTASPSR